jgi:hypothetical protein
MAGAGFKDFTTGEVLTANNVDTYLMQQTVMVFADAAARTTALTGFVAEGMLSYLKDTNSTEYYSGSAWVAVAGASGGMTVIQSGSLSGTTTSLTSIPATYKDLRLVIRGVYMTPTSTVYQFQFNSDTGSNYTYIWQNNTAATNATIGATQFQTTCAFPNSSNNAATIKLNLYDYASTTSYKLADLQAVGSSNDPAVFNTAQYNSSSAISSIQIKGNGQTVQGSYILYGVS